MSQGESLVAVGADLLPRIPLRSGTFSWVVGPERALRGELRAYSILQLSGLISVTDRLHDVQDQVFT